MLSNERLGTVVVISCLVFTFRKCACAETIQFYDENVDKIETINSDIYESVVVNSDRICVIEFYANWCGYSKSFIPHYKQFANETRLWRKKVLRVGAMDCALAINKDLCKNSSVKLFPSFLYFRTFSTDLAGFMSESFSSRSEDFMKTIINLMESDSITRKPENWPDLKPFK